MASIILTVAGSAIGNSLLPGIGGALLGGLGGAVGGVIDNALFGSATHVKGPRLDSLRVQDSAYGNGIPVLYGRNRLAGNVIWQSDLKETLHEEQTGGGKGGGSSAQVQTASYAVDCAIAIGEGDLGAIETIWADGKEVYAGGVWKTGIVGAAEFYLGSQSQNASAIMEGAYGAGFVPAYRGLAYLVMQDLQLGNFGNRLPNFTFEVVATAPFPQPVWMGEATPNLYGRPDSFANPAALAPISLQKRGTHITKILAGGIDVAGSDYAFCAIEYDVTGDAPQEITRTVSASVARIGGIQDVAWALSPDNRHVVFYMQHSQSGYPIALAVYDNVTRTFGDVLEDNVSHLSAHVQVMWLDSQHIVLPENQGGVYGVKLYQAAGLSLFGLGFSDVWGAGSSTVRYGLAFAQFGRIAGGLIFLSGNASLNPTVLYVRTLTWNNGALQVGESVMLTNSLPSFSATRAHIMAMDNQEFILARASSSQISLLSFTAGYDGAAITRAVTAIPISPSGEISVNFANSGNQSMLAFGHQIFGSPYGYGEIAITPTSFTLVQTTQLIDAIDDYSASYTSLYPIGGRRFLMQAGDSGNGFVQIGLFMRNPSATSLQVLVEDILTRSGYENSDYDCAALADYAVDGYMIPEPTSARGALEPLQIHSPFDLVESDGVLIAKPYTANSDQTLSTQESRAALEHKTQPATLAVTRAQELDLPASCVVDYVDVNLDYQKGSQRARRLTGFAHRLEHIRLPVVCTPDKAKQIAETTLYRSWVEREKGEAHFSKAYAALDVGDVIAFDGQNLRIIEQNFAGGIMRLKAVPVSVYALGSAPRADTSHGFSRIANAVQDTVLYIMDLPLLRAQDNQAGIYIAATGLTGWRGAGIYTSDDGINLGLQ